MSQISVGVDVGGTFTDFILLDGESGTWRTAKVPTTVGDLSDGFLQGLRELDVAPSAIDWLVHGTTAGTNAVLERKGAVCGLITTAGFRDVLELGRRTRPHNYGLSGSFEPLIPRNLRLEVPERIDAHGRIVQPLDEAAVRAAVERLREMGAESVVVHFLHAYANPAHEQRCAEIVREIWPNGHVVAGHEIIREMREFERGSTAAIHAAIRPIVTSYIDRVAERLKDSGYARQLLVMQANGGMMDASVVGENAAHTVMSGPAAGVLAAAEIARAAGVGNVITGDMGGTSYDVAVVVDGEPVITAEKDLAYAVPLRIPMIDIHTIGAGGGSIARVDSAGMLRVGPDSAGSYPGPIGYGRGGKEPTITDANLLLGRINPDAVTGSGGHAPLQEIEAAIDAKIGRPLSMDTVKAAKAVIDVAVNELAAAIRLISIEKGHDPRDFALMPYGGAGPLHAVEIARELGLPRVLVPRFPGLTSALGCILADVRHDFVQTVNTPVRELESADVDRWLADQAKAGKTLLEREGVTVETVEVRHEFDLLYQGQSHVIRLPQRGASFDPETVLADMTAHYQERFGITLPEMVPVLVNIRTTVIGVRKRPDLALFGGGEAKAEVPDASGQRPVYFGERWYDTKVYRREDMGDGSWIAGPAIVEQLDTTIVIDPGAAGRTDAFGNMIIDVNANAASAEASA
ncbi:hydantoinase/oxoprolinase family protein [Ferruginivarius sediminum]|uniref:hydantoinase/oxoprolinase family protein n=1 Tax=Ferruginivarius sediminum TaxID=2661937 RepID=UPI0019D496B1|nr:hydantoinase/oxoprolinase family protein [Ferruginivarius sediminum]